MTHTAAVPVQVGKGDMRHLRRDETTTVCGKGGVLRDLAVRPNGDPGVTCRGCNGTATAMRRFR